MFLFFFFLWLGEGKKKSKFQFHPSTNQCLLQSIKGEAGPGRFKGAERSGAERVGKRVSGNDGGVGGERMPRQKKWGLTTPEVMKKAGGEENGRLRDPHGGKKPWHAGKEWSEAEGRGEELGGGVGASDGEAGGGQSQVGEERCWGDREGERDIENEAQG